jgi:hypothetical protein
VTSPPEKNTNTFFSFELDRITSLHALYVFLYFFVKFICNPLISTSTDVFRYLQISSCLSIMALCINEI